VYLPLCTGTNDLTQYIVTYREVVFGMVIHSIYDAWHYEVLWTCILTRLLWHTCDDVHLILYIMLHSTNLNPNCQMHFFIPSQVCSEVYSWLHWIVHSQLTWLTLSRYFLLHSKCTSKYTSEYCLKYTSGHSLKDMPNCTRGHTPSLLDCTPPSKLTRHSEAYCWACSHIHSQLDSICNGEVLD